MLTHEDIWRALDQLAHAHGLSTSGLARKAGLDPTSFNRSKRATPQGRLRWPSTESIAKVLNSTDTTLEEFVNLLQGRRHKWRMRIPVMDLRKAERLESFTPRGEPAGRGWRRMEVVGIQDNAAFALKISDDDFAPVCGKGDVLIVLPRGRVRPQDRIIMQLQDGALLGRRFVKRGEEAITVRALGAGGAREEEYALSDVRWLSRVRCVLWNSA